MAATLSPYGLRPVSREGARGGDLNVRKYALTQTTATDPIFTNDLVALVAGQPNLVKAAAAAGNRATLPIGICIGCNFTDAIMGPRWQMYVPQNAANASSGLSSIFVSVVDDPWVIMQVQADGPVNLNQIGLNASLNFGSVPTGSTATGLSHISLNTASLSPGTASTLEVRIIDLVNMVGVSQPGDAYTDCLVMFNFGIHAFMQGTGG